MDNCCKNRKNTLDCLQGLGKNSSLRLLSGRLIFTKQNITIHGYNFTFKRNVSPFAYVYVTENGEEALIYYNAVKGTVRGSFELNDGRSFAFHPCFVYCLTRTERNISNEYRYVTYICYPEYVFYEYDQNYLREALKIVAKFV